jgi:sulfatase modifying factor 1
MNPSPPSPARKFPKTRSFPTFSLLAWLVCLMAPLHAQYAGNYSGIYTGDFSGVWSFTVDGSGNLTGRAVDTYGDVSTGSGTVSVAGGFAMVTAAGSGATFSGQINASGNVTGTWEDSYWLASGDVSGSRLPTTVAQYGGTYYGTLAGDTTGTWTATVDSAGNWTGTGTAVGFGTFGVNGIVDGTGVITTYIEEGGILTGQINQTGQVSGYWTDWTYSGGFTGTRTSTTSPDIAVERPADTNPGDTNPGDTNITDGESVSFGSVSIGSSTSLIFKIKNTGNANLTDLAITKDGTHAANFTVGALGATTLAPGISTTIAVTFTPSAAGSRTAAIHIASNDADESLFDINLTGSGTVPPLALGELLAPRMAITGGNVNLTVQPSVAGRSYQLQVSETMAAGSWQDLGAVRMGDGNDLVFSVPYVPSVRQRFYRLALVGVSNESMSPYGFTLIPAGSFLMGDQSNPLVGDFWELPVYTVQVSAFYIGKYEVTKEEWDAVRAWGLTNGYTDLAAGNGTGNGSYASKGANHPVHSIAWYDMVKWCNVRSQKEGLAPCYTVSGEIYKTGQSAPACNWSANGYRLPTEAEWEKAARGGVAGKNFPWGTDTISHGEANYYASFIDGTGNKYAYDVSPTRGYHPTYAVGGYPYSSPVGSFAPNGYGLYDMAGNMWEWCWDWYGSYSSTSQPDPGGPASGSSRVGRGGSWEYSANSCRVAVRYGAAPAYGSFAVGFRIARSSVP